MAEWIDFSDLIEKAQELIDLGLYDEAKKLLDGRAESFAGEWELYFLYSRYYAEQNKPAEAVHWLHKGLRLDPENVDCLVGLFYAHATMKRMQRAESCLLRAEKHHPGHELVLAAQIWYYTETNDLNAAIACFERLRLQGIDNQETFRNAGIAYDRAGSYDNAAVCFRTALELYPDYDEVRELLADLYINTGVPDKAVALYRQALSMSPNNIRHLSRLTFCLTENNEREKALETAEESIRLYPNSPIGPVDLAFLHLNSGAFDKAMAAADKAIDIAPLDAESRRVKALVLSELGDHAGAEAAFEKALSLDPDNSEILRDYYHHFRRTGDYQKMEKIISRVIARNDPSCVEDYWFFADYWRERGVFSKAFENLRKAYRIRPGEHEFLSMTADILIARGHTMLALKFLKRYVEHAGWNDIMDHIAACPQLRNQRLQEGLRFLRFCSSRPADYHRFVFSGRLRQAIAAALCAVLPSAAFLLFVLFGTAGLLSLAAAAMTGAILVYLVNLIRNRKTPLSFVH
jgi:tetratricopeptide (TPR) repeat protein